MATLLTLTGPSGCGKSTSLDVFCGLASESFRPRVIAKYTTRPARKDDTDRESIHVKRIPRKCDLVYEQYGVRYGLRSKELWEALAARESPLVILNDVRVVEDLQTALGPLVRSVFIFRQSPNLEHYKTLASARGVKSDADAERRFAKAQAIYRVYIENIQMFHHVIVNSSMNDLRRQVRQIVIGMEATAREE